LLIQLDTTSPVQPLTAEVITAVTAAVTTVPIPRFCILCPLVDTANRANKTDIYRSTSSVIAIGCAMHTVKAKWGPKLCPNVYF